MHRLGPTVSGNTFNADNEMTTFNGTALTYDANGNLVNDGTNTYAWDARNHLVSIAGANSAGFVYDAFGRRAAKTVNGTVTQFLYDRLNPLEELAGASPPNVTAAMLTGRKIDEFFQRTDPVNGSMTFLTDTLGSALALADATGAIQSQYAYEPFGKVTVSNPSATNPNPYQFTGRENDGTGLYFYRARYYHPAFQRFIAQDPIAFRGGDANLYAYVKNNSPNFADPFGRQVYQGPGWQQIGNLPPGPVLSPYPPGEPGMSCAQPPPPPPQKCSQSNIPHDWQDPIGAGVITGAGVGTLVCWGFGPCTLVGAGVGGAAGFLVWYNTYNCE